jgi:peptidyl-prolyl cis-trans isomerase A (cyclophilin A)
MTAPEGTRKAEAGPHAAMVLLQTALGDILIELSLDRAPLSAGQFLSLVDGERSQGGRFWRVVRPDNDCGDPPIQVVQGAMETGGAALPSLAHEPTSITGLQHRDGTVSLARAEPGTASAAAFFICVGAQPALDEGGLRNADGLGFAAFGKVVQGMEVVQAIHRSTTTAQAEEAYVRGQMLSQPVRFEATRKGEST